MRRRTLDALLTTGGLIVAVVLLVAGGLLAGVALPLLGGPLGAVVHDDVLPRRGRVDRGADPADGVRPQREQHHQHGGEEEELDAAAHGAHPRRPGWRPDETTMRDLSCGSA